MKKNIFELYDSTNGDWNKFDNDDPPVTLPPTSTTTEIETEKTRLELQKQTLESLSQKLKTAIQMPNIMVLAGSGTSLGPIVQGPSMWKLWELCTQDKMKALSTKSFKENGFDISKDENKNIELCLSHCEAFIQISPESHCLTTSEFILECKKIILDTCNFIKDDQRQLVNHREFIRKLSKRKSKDSRIKLFTTNYDTCFEDAASKLGITVIDGFSFSFPRFYDPKFFDLDIVKRNQSISSNNVHYLEGVFQLYKLHGSVNWKRENGFSIQQGNNVTAENSCMIFPAKGKYQQSYIQPHLELISRFTQGLREPNTCLIITGFGFNDDHLSEPILSAIYSNPHLKVIIATPSLKDDFAKISSNPSPYWDRFKHVANTRKNDELIFINCDFGKFSEIIPDLTALSPAENLYESLRLAFGGIHD
ncbi:SIR2 family protein [Acinetobacter sp. ANC 4779]|uniref:SIR2 family protein n=1 Tax=Acinetobacter sp. ANC 4779 TaxID=2529848 RepID=UPI001040899D|nr:SIR2 family protein [Acinetobacter sp. ANC 4779]TCB49132.1 SIR2 family protein [Acinetobacter sp. ANC 4779]